MKRIEVYDYSCSRIEDIAAKFDLTVAEVIEIMLDNIDPDEEEFLFG